MLSCASGTAISVGISACLPCIRQALLLMLAKIRNRNVTFILSSAKFFVDQLLHLNSFPKVLMNLFYLRSAAHACCVNGLYVSSALELVTQNRA